MCLASPDGFQFNYIQIRPAQRDTEIPNSEFKYQVTSKNLV